MDHEDIAKRFSGEPKFLDLAIHLNITVPDGREKSLAVTNLEQAMFWASAAIARQGGNE